jgi:oligopeptide transport system substrate-binding protein
LALLGAVALWTCGALAAEAINRGASFDPPSLDPNLGTGTAANPILSDMVEGLVGRAADGSVVAGCAESWSVSEDGLTYTFTLRPGLEWSDGRGLTAEDFVYSFRRLMDPATAARASGFFFVIANGREVASGAAPPESLGVDAPDARTVRIRLEQPAPYFVRLLANTQGVPVPRHVIEAAGKDWTRPGVMVSNGADMLAERVPQTYVKLIRNPRYFAADQVRIDTVYWRPVQDMGTAFRQFRAGELDTVLSAPPDELGWIRDNMPEALHTGPIQATYYLAFNVARAPFDDPRVRRALSLALDRDAIAGQVLQGTARPAFALVAPGTGGYAALRAAGLERPLAQRQAEARRLLAEAGFSPDQPLTAPVVYDTSEENRKIMIAVAAMWRDIGVRADVTNIEGRALMGKLMARDFGIARTSMFALYDDPYAFLSQLRSDNTANRTGYGSAEYDRLLDLANATDDPATRLARFAEAETLLLADQPLIPVYWYISKVLVAPRVQGWADAPLGTPPSRYLWLE